MPTWPATLPSKMRPPGGWRRTDTRNLWTPDTGPIHAARTSTREPRAIPIELQMSEPQFADLLAFYDTTLRGGIDTFDWTNPWAGAGLCVFFFLEPPDPVEFSRPQKIPSLSSGQQVRLIGAAVNPQRIVTVRFTLQWRNP